MLQWWVLGSALYMAGSDDDMANKFGAHLKVDKRKRTVILQYSADAVEAGVPPLCRDFGDMAMQIARSTGQAFGEDESAWHERLNLALFSTVFGAAHRHLDKTDFAPSIMIGESIRLLLKQEGALWAPFKR